MKITNYKDKYIKVESTYLKELIDHTANYDKLEVTGKIGCSATPVVKSIATTAIANNVWASNLAAPVFLNNKVYQLYIKSFATLKEVNVLTAAIDLGYVSRTCTSTASDCTLTTYASYFAPLFKAPIDAYFTSIGITSNVTVSFTANIVTITNLPKGFGIARANYAIASTDPYSEVLFGFGSEDSNLIVTDECMYINPAFFGSTSMEDGVYQVQIKGIKPNDAGFISETTCGFIDVTIKCKVANHLNDLLEKDFSSDAQDALLLHYALVAGSNCGCNCDDLCNVYNELLHLLTDSNIPKDCGC